MTGTADTPLVPPVLGVPVGLVRVPVAPACPSTRSTMCATGLGAPVAAARLVETIMMLAAEAAATIAGLRHHRRCTRGADSTSDRKTSRTACSPRNSCRPPGAAADAISSARGPVTTLGNSTTVAVPALSTSSGSIDVPLSHGVDSLACLLTCQMLPRRHRPPPPVPRHRARGLRGNSMRPPSGGDRDGTALAPTLENVS